MKTLTRIFILLCCAMICFNANALESNGPPSFEVFWTKFKAALAKDDKEAIALMTKLPFYYDKSLNKGEYIKRYSKIFDVKVKRCFRKEKPVKDEDSYSVFCGELIYIFAPVNGEYKFTEIGAND